MKTKFLATRAELDTCVDRVQRRLSADDPPAAAEQDAAAIFAGIARLGGVITGGQGASLLQRSAEQDLVDAFFP